MVPVRLDSHVVADAFEARTDEEGSPKPQTNHIHGGKTGMRLAWLTDIHLNFVEDDGERRQFFESVREQSDVVAISGDIAESHVVERYLREMEEVLQRPILFVLGNHDFYRGSIVRTREAVSKLAAESEYLIYLTASGVVQLTPGTAIIGHDGWADARLGDFENSDVMLNDYFLIEELRNRKDDFVLDKKELRDLLNGLGDEAGRHFEVTLTDAASRYARIIVVTHVPPFREAAWYEGRTCDDNWLPHFSCKATGDAILKVMKMRPQCELLVLCGHTHGSGETHPFDKLRVLTGDAKCGRPQIQEILECQ